jgi:hypothetical protein
VKERHVPSGNKRRQVHNLRYLHQNRRLENIEVFRCRFPMQNKTTIYSYALERLGLIKRFSEDIDFKVGERPASSASRARGQRTAYRQRVLRGLGRAGLERAKNRSRGMQAGRFWPILPTQPNSGRARAPPAYPGRGTSTASIGRPIGPLIAAVRRASRLNWQNSPA